MSAYPANADGEPPEWPLEGLWNDPAAPSIFDSVTFGLIGYAPPEWICHWDFGDGTMSNDCFVFQAKKYKQDGDYTVNVQVTNTEGEISSTSSVVSIRTHDVAITRFTVPQSARMGQTRQITVYVRNTRYLEKVQVELYKNDMVWIGTLVLDVPPRSANRTTAFNFTYTFSAEDVYVGKVTFKAIAFILENGGDDWQVDNEVVALPTRVFK